MEIKKTPFELFQEWIEEFKKENKYIHCDDILHHLSKLKEYEEEYINDKFNDGYSCGANNACSF